MPEWIFVVAFLLPVLVVGVRVARVARRVREVMAVTQDPEQIARAVRDALGDSRRNGEHAAGEQRPTLASILTAPVGRGRRSEGPAGPPGANPQGMGGSHFAPPGTDASMAGDLRGSSPDRRASIPEPQERTAHRPPGVPAPYGESGPPPLARAIVFVVMAIAGGLAAWLAR